MDNIIESVMLIMIVRIEERQFFHELRQSPYIIDRFIPI
jgi:hypothetical protein